MPFQRCFEPCNPTLKRALELATIVLVLFAILAVPPVYSGGLDFDNTVVDPNPPSGSSCCLDVCAIGDLDDDGIKDIVIGSEQSIGVVWYHAPTWTRYVIGDGSFTTDGETADVDGDGDTDVVISCISRRQIEWWENRGDPFSPNGWTRHVIGSNFAHDVAIGDMDGDRNVDVVVFRKGAEIVWFEAPANPRDAWTRRLVSSSTGEGLDVGDIDGDGDLDIAGSRNWYENNNGSGTSWTPHTISSSWGTDCRDIIADIDGDGDNDIALSHSEGSGPIAWFENPGWQRHDIDGGSIEKAHSLEVADFDLDGDADVMAGQMHTSVEKRVMVYENLGDGNSWNRTVLSTSGTHNARVGDVNNDAMPDIVGKNYDGTKLVEVWINAIPTAVGISSFAAYPADDGVRLEWSISESNGLTGFDIYRADGGEPFVKINDTKLGPDASSYVDFTAEAGRDYTYHLAAYDQDGTFLSYDVGVSVPAATVSLDPSYPNPFRHSTSVGFNLPAPSRVTLTVHDVAGRLVTTLLDEPRDGGYHELQWNGRDESGQLVRSGIYFYRLDAGQSVRVRKVVVVR